MKAVAENESRHLGQNEKAGLKGKSGTAGNMEAFKHELATIQKREALLQHANGGDRGDGGSLIKRPNHAYT